MIGFKVNCIASGQALCSPEWEVNEEGSSFHRLYYIYSGKVFYEDTEQKFRLKNHHIYIFPTKKAYKIHHNSRQPLQCLFFHVILNPIILNPTITLKVNNGSAIFYLIKALEQIVQNERDAVLMRQMLESLFVLMEPKVKFLVSGDERLKKVLDYIHNNYHEKLSNSDLAGHVTLDRYYFIRIFKKHFGVAPQKYVANYRFSKAFSFLQNGQTVDEVSTKVGFQDTKSFSRAFKKAVGVSPSNYKKSHLFLP